MICIECGREISDESAFCMYCGTEQDFEESDPEGFTEQMDDSSTKRRDALAPGQKESELLTSLRDGRRRRFSDPLTISLIIISSVLLVAFLALLFGRPAWEHTYASSDSTISESSSNTAAISVAEDPEQTVFVFNVRQIQLSSGERFDLSGVIEHREDVPLKWSSSNSKEIEVDANGTVTAHVPGSAVTIEASAANGGYLSQTIRVLCLSEEAKALIAEASSLNTGSESLGEIDTRTVRFVPASRNISLYWDKALFYSLEDFPDIDHDGRINLYRIEKRKMQSADTGNTIDYEIYRSPNLGLVNKITAIEYLPDNLLEISEYYFENSGELNFVFVHIDTSYTPSRPAAPNISGDRYYFENDVMVKWRTVDAANGVRDLVLGEKEKQNSPSLYTIVMYSDADETLRSQFDELEGNVLNKAYATYFSVIAEKESSRVLGSVTDEEGIALANVSVSLICADMNDTELFRALTDEDGLYTINIPTGNHRYALRMEKSDAVPVYISDVATLRRDVDTYVEPVKMTPISTDDHPVRMVVVDAVNKAKIFRDDDFSTEMLRIPDAEIRFREGIGNVSGNVIQTVFSDTYGVAEISLPAGAYTVEIVVSGYESSHFTIYSYTDCALPRFCLSPVLGKGEMRVILTWSEEPKDLDAHLFTPFVGLDTGTESHIWFRSRTDLQGNILDVDATDGFGPETVTIGNVAEGLYKYYVTNFTDCIHANTSSIRMSYSSALVHVYSENGLIASFHVPPGNEGVIWEVFEIRNGSVVPIHRYYSSIADKPWWNTDKQE